MTRKFATVTALAVATGMVAMAQNASAAAKYEGFDYSIGDSLGGKNGGTGFGGATMWLLSESAFNTIASDGSVTETELDNNASGIATDSQPTSGDATLDGFVHLFMNDGARGATIDPVIYDELRYGSSVADVTPVPAPSAAVSGIVLAMGLTGFGLRRQRR
jgi:hypothetical protein